MNWTFVFIIVAVGISIGTLFGISRARALEPSREVVAWELIDAGALLVDTRTSGEFAAGHLDGALNISHDETEARVSEYGDDKARQIVVYCRSGKRAGVAEKVLRAHGFTRVHNGGGYEALLKAKP